jgi:hypothetical protein
MADTTTTGKRKQSHVLFTMAFKPAEREQLHRAAADRQTSAAALIRQGLEAVGVPLAA